MGTHLSNLLVDCSKYPEARDLLKKKVEEDYRNDFIQALGNHIPSARRRLGVSNRMLFMVDSRILQRHPTEFLHAVSASDTDRNMSVLENTCPPWLISARRAALLGAQGDKNAVQFK